MRRILPVLVLLLSMGSASGQTGLLAKEPPIRPEEAAPTISWKDAGNHVGREVFLVGKVEQSSRARTGHAFLNFTAERGHSVVIFIKKEFAENFPEPPEKAYRGKLIKVRGFVTEFKGAPQIAVTRPEAIEVLPDGTALPAIASRPAARAATVGDTITIGSYNLLNLFDAVDDPYTDDEGTPTKPREQALALARVIRRLNADVLAVVEVENRGILQQFVNGLLSDMGYQVVLFEGNDTRGIDVGLLSRLPVGRVTSHRHLRFPDARGRMIQYQRDLLEVRIEPEGFSPFDVFVVHFKSKSGEDDGGLEIRQGEALQTRSVLENILKERPQARFVVCGDFNDTIDSEPLRALLGSGPTALTSFVTELSPGETVTYNLKPYLSMIDFILASPEMAKRYVSQSYHVIVGGSPEASGSDHNPVVAKFRLD